MSAAIEAPPHAMFRVLIRWGRFVFEPHAAPATAAGHHHQHQQHGGSGGNGGDMSSVEQATGTEYRLVWFRAIDGVAIGHTKWCSLTLLHSVVSVVDFQSAPAVVDIASGYMSNTATRVVLLQLQQRSVDPSLDPTVVMRHGNDDHHQHCHRQASSPPVVAATGAVDIGMFVGSPPRSYIVTLEASFFAVGKLHMNLVVKEPKLDIDHQPLAVSSSGDQLDATTGSMVDLPFGQQSSPTALLRQKQAQLRKQQRRNLERLTVLVVDSIEAERNDGGTSKKIGVYGLARLLQDKTTEDNRFPLPSESVYQLKVSFVSDPKYVAKPMLARQHVTAAAAQKNSSSAKDGIVQHSKMEDGDHRTPSQNLFNRAPLRDGEDHHHHKNKTGFVVDALGQAGDVAYDDDESYSLDRKVVTFRTMLQKPHDGRVLWRCGIAMSPCTKIKFALYRDQHRIGSTAIMASQLAVAKMPHDFSLPIKVRHIVGNHVQVQSLQINLTLSEHTLDTVSSEVISSYLNNNNSNNNNEDHVTASANASSNVCLVPGSDIMVLLRGYEVPQEEKNLDEYIKTHPEALPFSKDDDDNDNDNEEGNSYDDLLKMLSNVTNSNHHNSNHQAQSSSPATRRSRANTATPLSATRYNNNKNSTTDAANNRSSSSPTANSRFSDVAPIVFPQDLKPFLDPNQTKGFVGGEMSVHLRNETVNDEAVARARAEQEIVQSENRRLEAENDALRTALQEQEERIRDQESYILTLLENQGVVAVDEDDEEDEEHVLYVDGPSP